MSRNSQRVSLGLGLTLRYNLSKKKERDHLGDPGVDGRIILRWIFRKWDVGVWTGSIWVRTGTGGGHL